MPLSFTSEKGFLVFVSVCILSFTTSALPSFAQSKNYTIEQRTPMNPANEGSATAVTTDKNGYIYSVWMDPNRNMKIARMNPNDGYSSDVRTVHSNMQVDINHVRPSVAIDKQGFIHVTGNMHHDNWCYYISNTAYSVAGGFRRVTNIPGRGVSYPEFYKDKVDELYITFRHTVNDENPRRAAGGVMRYKTGNSTFIMLGGTSHGYDKTLVFANAAGCDGHYQKPSIRLHFDRNNRMHLVATLIAESTGSSSNDGGCDRENTHVLYAYSDDGGQTFRKANGNAISALPLTPASNSMSVVYTSSNNDIVSDVRVGAFAQGPINKTAPVVSFRTNTTFLKKWTGSNWVDVEGVKVETGGTYSGKISGVFRYILSDAGGYGTTVFLRPDTDDGGYITRDGGNTFTKFKINFPYASTSTVSLDEEYFQQTNNLRLQYSSAEKDSNGNPFLYLIKFSLDNVGQRTADHDKPTIEEDQLLPPTASFSVYPNPTVTGNMTVEGATLDKAEVYLYDLSGRPVPFTTRTLGEQSLELQVANFSPGVFLLTLVQEDGQTQHQKILLQ